MKLDELNFLLPKDLLDLLDLIHGYGFKASIVGGMVRDYLMTGEISHDYDLEVRPLQKTENLIEDFEELVEALETSYEIEHLAYQVKKIKLLSTSCELTLPRVETYNGEFNHSNFEASYISDSDYSLGYKRRDFTLNAMYLEYDKTFTFIDPLNGKSDLENKILRPCSEDFYQDPVRYLRGLRFSIKYDLHLCDELLSKYADLSLSDFSPYYLAMEANKSFLPLTFFNKLIFLVEGKQYSQFDKVIFHEYETRFINSDMKKFLSQAIFLSDDFLNTLGDILKFKMDHIALAPYSFRDITRSPYEVNEQLQVALTYFKKITMLDSEILNFYHRHNYFDLSIADIAKLKQIKIDVKHLPNEEKKFFEFYHKLKALDKN